MSRSEVRSRVAELRVALEAVADRERAPAMEAYMKHRFTMLGVSSPDRKSAQRDFIASFKPADTDAVIAAAAECWKQPEREFHYVAADLLRRSSKRLAPEHLPAVRRLIVTNSWWDTVDTLASNVVGPMVLGHPELAGDMDVWAADADLWVARTAILHQLKFRDRTDTRRLFDYCEAQAAHPDFFIRKAIGWALREYAKTDADAVAQWVAEHDEVLSGLSKREALKHIG